MAEEYFVKFDLTQPGRVTRDGVTVSTAHQVWPASNPRYRRAAVLDFDAYAPSLTHRRPVRDPFATASPAGKTSRAASWIPSFYTRITMGQVARLAGINAMRTQGRCGWPPVGEGGGRAGGAAGPGVGDGRLRELPAPALDRARDKMTDLAVGAQSAIKKLCARNFEVRDIFYIFIFIRGILIKIFKVKFLARNAYSAQRVFSA